jgi:hypothetical protein
LLLGLFIVSLTASISGPASQQEAQLRPGEVPPGYVEIDGSKSPMSIPDWMAWGSALRLLADAAGNERSQFYSELQLSPAEHARVVKVALAQNDRDRACEERILALGQRLLGVDQQRILSLTQQEQIRFRGETLAEADALVASLSSGAVHRLTRLVDEMRASARVMVPREGLAQFRRPR